MNNSLESNDNFWQLLKKGNKSSAIAMGGNAVLAVIKMIVATIGGSGALFASALHSFADTINQGFVYVGSAIAEKKPTKKFPLGFGRLINIFCMIAVIVVTIMAYETLVEGWSILTHPAAIQKGLWLSVGVLIINILVDGSVLIKVMNEIMHEARVDAKGFAIFTGSFKYVGRAAPPTRLVFYEDLVAVSGATFALIATIGMSLSSSPLWDGIATLIIGFLMLCVAFKVGYDNMVGLIGVAAPEEVQTRVKQSIMTESAVSDINSIRIIQEGRYYHVEGLIELQSGMTLSEADDVKFKVRDKLLQDPDISDVMLGIMNDDGVQNNT